ncbi:hypothetical protein UT300011_18510 [Clostridium perfringens]
MNPARAKKLITAMEIKNNMKLPNFDFMVIPLCKNFSDKLNYINMLPHSQYMATIINIIFLFSVHSL